MVITPHALTGAAAGKEKPIVQAFASGFVSHFALDKIPHRDYSLDGLPGKIRALADMAAATGLVASTGGDRKSRLAGAFGGIAPDLLCLAGRGGAGVLGRFVDLHDRSHTKRGCGFTQSWIVQTTTAAVAFALLRSSR